MLSKPGDWIWGGPKPDLCGTGQPSTDARPAPAESLRQRQGMMATDVEGRERDISEQRGGSNPGGEFPLRVVWAPFGSWWKVPAGLSSSQGNTDVEFEILVRFPKT